MHCHFAFDTIVLSSPFDLFVVILLDIDKIILSYLINGLEEEFLEFHFWFSKLVADLQGAIYIRIKCWFEVLALCFYDF